MTVLDETVLKQLERDINTKTLKKLLEMFIEETEERLQAIQQLSQREQWDSVAREGHTLKSTAGSFGLKYLCNKAQELDESCQRKNYQQAKKLCEEIPPTAQHSLATLRHWMQTH